MLYVEMAAHVLFNFEIIIMKKFVVDENMYTRIVFYKQ